jgi:hypothetical protein
LEDTGGLVALDDVILVKHVAAVDVRPQPGTDVVVDMIAAKDDTIIQDDLHAAGFPLEVETMDVMAQTRLFSMRISRPRPPIPIWPL